MEIFTTGATSTHFVIDKEGNIQEFINPTYRAYHAGIGNLNNDSKLNAKLSTKVLQNDMNSWSIGIENVNNGNEEFSKAQIQANILLCQHLQSAIPSLDKKLMLGHADWAVGRKIDPSIFFPWEKFANASEVFHELGVTKNFGIFPRKSELNLKTDPNVILSYESYVKRTLWKRI